MPIDSLLDKYAQEDSQGLKIRLSNSAMVAHNVNPDQHVKNQQEARKAGIHPALATPAESPVDAHKAQGLISDFHKLPTTAPATAQYLSDIDNAKKAHDDHPVLSKLEGLFNTFKGAGARMAQGVNESLGSIDRAFGMDRGVDLYEKGAAYWQKVAERNKVDGLAGKVYEGVGSAPAGVAEFVAGVPYAAAKGAAEGYRKDGMRGLIAGALTESVKRYGVGKVFKGIETSAMSPIKKSLTMAGTMGAQTAAEGGGIKDVVASTLTGLAIMPPAAGSHGDTVRSRLVSEGVDPHIAEEIKGHVDGVIAHENAGKIKEVVDTAKESKLAKRAPEDFPVFTRAASKNSRPVSMPVDQFDAMLTEKGLKPEDVLTDPAAYYEARGAGVKLEIPASDLANMAQHVEQKHIDQMSLDGDPSVAETEAKQEEKQVDSEQGEAPKETQAPPQEDEKQQEAPIRPAVQTPEGIKVGEDGGHHNDIVPDADESTRGFVTPQGDFMGRAEASEYLKSNSPELYSKLPESGKQELHSEHLWEALDHPEDTVNLHMGINPLHGVKAAMDLAGDIRSSKIGKQVEKLLTPGLEAASGIKQGALSLVLPTAKSEAHLEAGETLGKHLGKMHRNQEAAADQLRADELVFDKMGVNGDGPLTDNEGIQFMSDMSQGRQMSAKLQPIADRIKAMFDDRLSQLEAAGKPLETIRDNYFPGMWTNDSRKAFNLAIAGAKERGIGGDVPLDQWTPEDKAYVHDRVKALLKDGKGSEKDGIQYLAKRPFKGKESFRKEKVFDDIMTAVEFGLEPTSPNPITLAKLKLAEMERSIMANGALQEWREQGKEKFLPIGQQVPEGWEKVNDKYGAVYGPRDMAGEDTYIGIPLLGHRIVTKDVADVLNNYLSSSLYNNKYFGTLYKGYMGMANALNQSQLGVGSFFHVGFTESEVTISAGADLIKDIWGVAAGSRSVKQLAKTAAKVPAAFIKTPIEGGAILNAWRNPDVPMDPKVQQIAKAAELAGGGFKLEQGMRTGQTSKMIQDWYSDRKVKAALRSPISAIEMMAKPIMDYLVPRQKAGVFGHLAARIIEQNPGKALEDLTPEFRQAWNRVDSRLGQVRYDRLYMNNAAKNAVQGLVRAPGWSGGTIAEIGGAVKDSAKFLKEWVDTGKAPKELPDRVAYTAALMTMVTAANGLMTYLFTGEEPNGTDFWAFRTGDTDEYGRPERFLLPTYLKDVYAYMEDPGKTLTAKTHPVISIMADLIKNKDYYGVTIANEDDNAIMKAIERGEYVLKAFVPFWMRGAHKESERGGGLMQTLQDHPEKILAPQIGIMPATSDYTKSASEKLLSKYIGEQIPQGGRTQEQADTSKARREIVRALRNGATLDTLPDDLRAEAEKLTERQLHNIEKDAELTPLQSSFQHMQDPDLQKSIKVWAKTTDTERDQLRDMYELRINKYFATHNLEDSEIEQLNQQIEKAENRE